MRKLSFSGRAAVATALILAVGVPATALGFGEGRNLLLGKRNPSRAGLSSETQIIADNTTYGTRQSNLRDGDGGGAIYGCRSNPGTEPCIRANNLKGGRAFEFATVGNEAGRIETVFSCETLPLAMPISSPSSSSVGSRPSSSLIWSDTRRIFEILSTRWTGNRIVLLWFARARLIDCLIHHEP